MTRSPLLLGILLSTATAIAACAADTPSKRPRVGAARPVTGANGQVLPDYNDPHVSAKEGLPEPLDGLLRGPQQTAALCARSGVQQGSAATSNEPNPQFNAVTNAFCRDPQTVNSIKDLQKALGINFIKTDPSGTNGSNGNPGFAFLAHSSSLVSRSVSAINPRAIVFQAPPGQPVAIQGFVGMTFVRGEPFVEVVAQAAKQSKLSFYLIRFSPACEATNSCGNGDLLTPATESNWQSVGVYDDEDLKNTLLDCRSCHQPDGPNSPLILRMQELQDPWTHWFRSDRPGGIALMADFFRAHGPAEDYAGIPAGIINKSDGKALEDFVEGQGFGTQPNGFNSKVIENEIDQSSASQPEINVPPGKSPTWDGLYEAAFNGQFIPPPYHDVKVTDPDKLQFATQAYQAFVGGGSPSALPDIRRVFLDAALEQMTMIPESGASGRQVLVQTCAQCHNPKLDQTLSRAKFDVTALDSMPRDEKVLAITRMNLDPSDRLHMPPAMMRTLPDDARAQAISELQK